MKRTCKKILSPISQEIPLDILIKESCNSDIHFFDGGQKDIKWIFCPNERDRARPRRQIWKFPSSGPVLYLKRAPEAAPAENRIGTRAEEKGVAAQRAPEATEKIKKHIIPIDIVGYRW